MDKYRQIASVQAIRVWPFGNCLPPFAYRLWGQVISADKKDVSLICLMGGREGEREGQSWDRHLTGPLFLSFLNREKLALGKKWVLDTCYGFCICTAHHQWLYKQVSARYVQPAQESSGSSTFTTRDLFSSCPQILNSGLWGILWYGDQSFSQSSKN